MEIDYNILISTIAIIISIISLSWNIYNKLKSERKRILINSYKSADPKGDFIVIMLTNTGKKPIFIRRIDLHAKLNGEIKKLNVPYQVYRERFENKPINPEHWETIIIKESEYFKLRNEDGKYFETKIILVDPTGKKFKTNWFRQHVRG